ncbi:imidazolonepropionase [Cytobacillus sp. Sa5YUA1]|uniref:Imidazolonepropionase n=1 Tax=Cytobacillus stercorigallinarum TaxID=2762240 RepID=A0ABR8QQ98_9BACI|nr:imidazolonepropionase [Cytobacillus stercorigallinarum]MBD7937714.1 imidazolonepropionase [Cytobacillus stercorigallinarum]
MNSTYLFIKHANELLTLKGHSQQPAVKAAMNQLHVINDGAILIKDEHIVAIGETNELISQFQQELNSAEVIDASGKVVMPGLVDPHTHLVYAGSREEEFNMRLNGATYMEIMNNGGGIHATTSKTRAATIDELKEESLKRLDSFLMHGVTTIEAKSGYGLDWETEYKQLFVAKELNRLHAIDIVSTFMGAHAIPAEYKKRPDAFIDLIIDEMLPLVVEEELAVFNDVFCEGGVFTPEQSKKLLLAGKNLGLIPKIHADEIEPYGGAELAAAVGAISADHLLKASDEGIKKMAAAGVIAVLLPGTAFFLMEEAANGRKMIDEGVAVALSTDCNPGSSPTTSLPFMMNLACMHMGLTPAEAIYAATINAAHAIGKGHEVGSLEEGKKADILILDVPNYMQTQYLYGMNHTHSVIKAGRIVIDNGALVINTLKSH